MKKQHKEIGIGFLIALFACMSGTYLYIELFSKYNFAATLKMVQEGNLYGELITLGALANLFVFFVYIKKKQDARAKGVLIATFVIAFVTLVLKLKN